MSHDGSLVVFIRRGRGGRGRGGSGKVERVGVTVGSQRAVAEGILWLESIGTGWERSLNHIRA